MGKLSLLAFKNTVFDSGKPSEEDCPKTKNAKSKMGKSGGASLNMELKRYKYGCF